MVGSLIFGVCEHPATAQVWHSVSDDWDCGSRWNQGGFTDQGLDMHMGRRMVKAGDCEGLFLACAGAMMLEGKTES